MCSTTWKLIWWVLMSVSDREAGLSALKDKKEVFQKSAWHLKGWETVYSVQGISVFSIHYCLTVKHRPLRTILRLLCLLWAPLTQIIPINCSESQLRWRCALYLSLTIFICWIAEAATQCRSTQKGFPCATTWQCCINNGIRFCEFIIPLFNVIGECGGGRYMKRIDIIPA